jgi:hypothetical protein
VNDHETLVRQTRARNKRVVARVRCEGEWISKVILVTSVHTIAHTVAIPTAREIVLGTDVLCSEFFLECAREFAMSRARRDAIPDTIVGTFPVSAMPLGSHAHAAKYGRHYCGFALVINTSST